MASANSTDIVDRLGDTTSAQRNYLRLPASVRRDTLEYVLKLRAGINYEDEVEPPSACCLAVSDTGSSPRSELRSGTVNMLGFRGLGQSYLIRSSYIALQLPG